MTDVLFNFCILVSIAFLVISNFYTTLRRNRIERLLSAQRKENPDG